MKVRTLGLTMGLLASASPAWAAERTVSALDPAAYAALKPSDLSPGDIKYTQNIVKWADWSGKFATDQKVMALYPGYKEATYWARKKGEITSQPEPLIFYYARTKTIVDRAATSIDLKAMTQYAQIKKMVPDLTFGPAPISNGQLVATYLKNKQPVPSFAFCNAQANNVTRQKFEINLDESQPPASAREPWCSNQARSTCFEACVVVMDGVLAAGISKYNETQADDEKKDLAEGLQAEARYFVSEAERGDQKGTFDSITKVGTDVAGLVELNIFYVNQIIQFGKVITVLQPDPNDARRTVMTTLVLIAVKSHSWLGANNGGPLEKFKAKNIRSFLMGDHVYNMGKRGLLGGIPMFTQDVTKNLANVVEGAGS